MTISLFPFHASWVLVIFFFLTQHYAHAEIEEVKPLFQKNFPL